MEKYTYEKSGVSLANSDVLTNLLSAKLKTCETKNFAGQFKLPEFNGFSLVATTDGVGTKVLPLIERKMYKALAQDLAAMNLNDLACLGAKPLFFLDYTAANVLEPNEIASFLEELNLILSKYNCVLLGGETSEMGDIIQKGVFDTAGFLVGMVEDKKAPNKDTMREGDIVIGLKSTGVNSNGFSLVRQIYADGLISEEKFIEMLAPTAIYTNEVLTAIEKKLIISMANITGGGILSNLKRAIPEGFQAVLDRNALPKMSVFETLKQFVDMDEMFKTFNMGAGFCVVVHIEDVAESLDIFRKYDPFIFGKIEKTKDDERCIFKN